MDMSDTTGPTTQRDDESTLDNPVAEAIDLDAIETDLADVEIALARLDAGTYWTCEITGEQLSHELLLARPTARRGTSI